MSVVFRAKLVVLCACDTFIDRQTSFFRLERRDAALVSTAVSVLRARGGLAL
jgi:hypothetical protein